MLKPKLPPSKITVPALAFENIPVGGEHRLVPLTVQTDGLHDGQWVPATLTVVVEGSVQYGAECDPRLGLGLGAESLTPCQENVLDEKQKILYQNFMSKVLFSTCVLNNIGSCKNKNGPMIQEAHLSKSRVSNPLRYWTQTLGLDLGRCCKLIENYSKTIQHF